MFKLYFIVFISLFDKIHVIYVIGCPNPEFVGPYTNIA